MKPQPIPPANPALVHYVSTCVMYPALLIALTLLLWAFAR